MDLNGCQGCYMPHLSANISSIRSSLLLIAHCNYHRIILYSRLCIIISVDLHPRSADVISYLPLLIHRLLIIIKISFIIALTVIFSFDWPMHYNVAAGKSARRSSRCLHYRRPSGASGSERTRDALLRKKLPLEGGSSVAAIRFCGYFSIHLQQRIGL